MKDLFLTGLLLVLVFSGATRVLSTEQTEVSSDEAALEEWLRGDELEALDIPEFDQLLPPLPVWDAQTTFKAGLGYRDNVMLSAVEPRGGSFLLAGLESSLVRVPPDGPRFSFFLEAEHLEFFSGSELPNDTFIAAHSQAGFPLPRDFTLTFRLMAFYLDQVMDVSTLQAPIAPIEVRGHGLAPSASLRKEWQTDLFVEASALASRQEFQAPLHDYWEYGTELAAGFSPANSETSLSLQYVERPYDDRPARSAAGDELPQDVTFRILRPQLKINFAWGEQARWRSRGLFGFEFNRDNLSDYFAYDRVKLSHQLGFRQQGWELDGGVSYSFFDYKVQRVPGTEELRYRHSWRLDLEARRHLMEQLAVFARYSLEKVRSNERETDYEVNTWTAGLSWSF